MLQSFREWIINICTGVFFITAVEIILPDNSLKKYGKFVLGLILITVFINPIIKVFDRNFDINTYTEKAIETFPKNNYPNNFSQYKQKNIDDTLNVFKLNLQTSCEKKLKEKYPVNNYKVQVDAEYDSKSEQLLIKDIKVGVKEGNIEKIKKVSIGNESKSVNTIDEVSNEKSSQIKQCLSDEIKVSKDIIQVYKL